MALVLTKGRLVGERYLLERLLGTGGMGAVWAATHQVTRKRVALKFLKGTDAYSTDGRRRFLREARAASAVSHPNVVQIHDIFELDDGALVMVMDLLTGESLRTCLQRARKLSPSEVAAILVPVVSAVGTAHAIGIVHRDLKPDNIFIVELPDGKRDVRVLDFGIAKITSPEGDAGQSASLTQPGAMLGTPHYMAPEQVSGEAGIDHRADIWALGVILYECLAGRLPFLGDNVGQILKRIITGAMVPLEEAAPDLPKDLREMIGAMLSQERADRPADLRAVQSVLGRYTEVLAPSFGEAQPGYHPPEPPEADEPSDPYGATVTLKARGQKPERIESAGDPRLRAEAGTPEIPAASPRRRARLALWMGGSVVVLVVGAFAARWQQAGPVSPPPSSPSPSSVPPAAVVVVAPTPPPRGQLTARTGAPRVQFRLDGSVVGDGSGVLDLADVASGKHHLAAESRGFQPREGDVEVRAGERLTVDWTLAARKAAGHRSTSVLPDAPTQTFRAP